MSEDKEFVTLKDLLDNPPRILEITGIGKVKIKDPTTRDRIDAQQEAKQDPRWKDMSEAERNALVFDYLALKMLVEPKVTPESYFNTNSVLLSNIVSAVVMDYTLKFKKLTDLRSKEIKDFLEQTKVDNQ